MKVIGITGGVGSGKSLVLSWLAGQHRASCAVIEADKTAHRLQQKGNSCYHAIVQEFGRQILDEKEEISRTRLGSMVFGDKERLERLNAIVHPLVKQEIIRQLKDYRRRNDIQYVFIEAALLIEEHYDVICDELWYIYVDKNKRIERLKESRGYTDTRIQQMMDRQLDEQTFRSCCQVVIDNNGSAEDTFRQIREVLAWQNE